VTKPVANDTAIMGSGKLSKAKDIGNCALIVTARASRIACQPCPVRLTSALIRWPVENKGPTVKAASQASNRISRSMLDLLFNFGIPLTMVCSRLQFLLVLIQATSAASSSTLLRRSRRGNHREAPSRLGFAAYPMTCHRCGCGCDAVGAPADAAIRAMSSPPACFPACDTGSP
jgi:hypothetical protein